MAVVQEYLPPYHLDADGAWPLTPDDPDGAAEHGWYVFERGEQPQDTADTVYDRWEARVVDGVPVGVWIGRPRREDEPWVSEIEQNARLTDLEARVARLEALVEPPPPNPTDPADPSVKTWVQMGGVWPVGGLLREGSTVYRNVTTQPLTTPPSQFPGDASAWTHLFVVVLAPGVDPPPPDPEGPPGYVGTWSASAAYKVGDVVDRNGRYYRCKIAHGSEYQGTWGPPAVGVWDDIGSVETLNRIAESGKSGK